MSNIKLFSGMKTETEIMDSRDLKPGDHVAIGDDLIYEAVEGYPGGQGVPVWSRKADRAVTGRQVDLASITGNYATKFEVITLVH